FLPALSNGFSCAGQARFHRVLSEPQYPRDFRYGDLLDVLQDQHFAILGPELLESAAEFPIGTGVVRRSGCLFIDWSRAHQAGTTRIGADERKNFAMCDGASEGEQRAVAAEER